MDDFEGALEKAALTAVDLGATQLSVDASAPQSGTATAFPSWATGWGHLLRTARQITGLSLNQLSTATGLSKSYLSKLETGANGAANPSRATLAALARALPSFRPLAHTLEPALGTAELDYQGILPTPHTTPTTGSPATPAPCASRTIELGWRELEVLMALLSLEAAAIPLSITVPVLARATGRDVAAITRTLDRLVGQHLAHMELPTRAGGVATFRCSDDALDRLGVARLGDLLMLGAALLGGAPSSRAASLGDRPTVSSQTRDDNTR